jgi:hypothetical protein
MRELPDAGARLDLGLRQAQNLAALIGPRYRLLALLGSGDPFGRSEVGRAALSGSGIGGRDRGRGGVRVLRTDHQTFARWLTWDSIYPLDLDPDFAA